jgi:hypothetical protein
MAVAAPALPLFLLALCPRFHRRRLGHHARAALDQPPPTGSDIAALPQASRAPRMSRRRRHYLRRRHVWCARLDMTLGEGRQGREQRRRQRRRWL